MQRVEHFNRVIEHLTAPSSSGNPSASSSSGSSSGVATYAPLATKSTNSGSKISSAAGSPPRTMIGVCFGKDYLSGDIEQDCGCNAPNSVVQYQTGDGLVLVDMCQDGSVPINNTNNYCSLNKAGNPQGKLVYELANNTISYRTNALTQLGPSVPAITRRWCAAPGKA